MSDNDKEIANYIQSAIRRVLENDDMNIENDANLKEAYDIDSFDFTQILVEIEDQFKMRFPPREANKIKTINDFIRLISHNKI